MNIAFFRRLIYLSLALFFMTSAIASSPEKIRLQLKWYHQFQFAGYYAAQLKGFYKAENLDVELLEGSPRRSSGKVVLDGEADFGVHDGGDLVFLYLKGNPIVAVATIFQHSPYVLIVKKSSKIRHPSDLVGRTVLVTQDQGDAPILAMFKREGIKVASGFDSVPIRFKPHSWNFEDLKEGRADAMSAYLSELPSIARLHNLETVALKPLDYGIDFYGDTLFTSKAYLEKKPEVVERFRRASLRGWSYAFEHPGEIIDYIQTLPTSRSMRLDRQSLVDEAQVLETLVIPKLVEIGHMNPGRWEQMAKTYLEFGMGDASQPIDDFLYSADAEKQRIRTLLQSLGLMFAVAALITIAGVIWLRQLKRQVHAKTRELREEVAERKAAQDKYRLAANAFAHAREGIVITSPAGIIIEVNEAFVQITGYAREEIIGKTPRILRSNRQNTEFYKAMWRTLLKNGYWNGEIWNRRKDGSIYPGLLTISAVRDDQGVAQQYVSLFTDITPIKQHEQQLERMAHFDLLTKLPNRVLLADRLQQGMAQTKRRRKKLAVVYLDLDGFKAINDQHGHAVGDSLLVEVARQMQACLRESDTLARLGGDEFVAILLDIQDGSSCVPLLHRLLNAVARETVVGGLSLKVSASLGVSFFPQTEDVDADQLLRQADQAMYQAKLAGKNQYQLFDTEHDRNMRGRHESVERVRKALSESEFVLHFQPKINLRTRQVIGVEALIRWLHPERGLLAPLSFLPTIENTPMAIELGEWVIEAALQQGQEWRYVGLELPISVNVGATQLQQSRFSERLHGLIARYPGFRRGDLEIEILETSALEDFALASKTIQACRDIGIEFSLDDFGTGYSSLTYLKKLDVDVIKIDQIFVRDMFEDPDDQAILKGIVSLSAAFGRKVLAEGVETVDQGRQLLRLGCELAQGYGIARPMVASAIPEWIQSWQHDTSWNISE